MSSSSKSMGSAFRGSRRKVRLLMLIASIFTLLGAVLFAGLAPFSPQTQESQLFRFAAYFGGASVAIFLLRFLLFVLPDIVMNRRSPSRRMRREEYASHSGRRARRAQHHPAQATQGGGVLILMLVLVGLIAALLLQSHALIRARSNRQHASQERTRLRQAATEAARVALQRLADDEDLNVDATSETWAVKTEEESPLGIVTRTSIRDEQARFDLNNLAIPPAPGRRSSEDIAMDIQTLCGDFSPAIRTAALRDFMDEDNSGAREGDFYRKLQPPLACPNRPLYGWGEILNVDGWTEEQLARRPREDSFDGFDASLVDHVTLIPVSRTRPIPININTATRETLRAVMGMDQDALVDTVLTLREIRPIRQLDVFSVTAGPGTFDRLQPFLDVRSQYFRVHTEAEQDGRRLGLEVLVKRESNGRVSILQWVEEPT
ncbi:MAG: type II secretion system protein GspK [Kiritimatiellae bacterium]|nr:type II secretion system protein GspK [Kiritimatiellia bacterium]